MKKKKKKAFQNSKSSMQLEQQLLSQQKKKMPEFCQANTNLLRFQIKVHKSFFLGLLILLKETENCEIYLFWIT